MKTMDENNNPTTPATEPEKEEVTPGTENPAETTEETPETSTV